MGFDYTFKIDFADGTRKEASYQSIIKSLEIEDVEAHGKPLSEGGAPQALSVAKLLVRVWDDASKVEVYFNGSQIF